VLGYAGEEDIPLDTHHRGLVRYDSSEDELYEFVMKTLVVKLEELLVAAREQRGTA